jgi:thiaminase/transcriptional activator TenA
MTFTDEVWEATATIRSEIDSLPFLVELETGDLSAERFAEYLAQDALYLEVYARVLAAAGDLAPTEEHRQFWLQQAASTVAFERQMHDAQAVDGEERNASPTCTAYTSYLLALAGSGNYGEVVAGLLPCFWIYDDVGRRLLERVSAEPGVFGRHPYSEWIATYGDEVFHGATTRAKELADETAGRASDEDRQAMHRAFLTASRYEWMFWNAAHALEVWPV